VTKVLLDAGSDTQRPNKHGLTPLDCALGGAQALAVVLIHELAMPLTQQNQGQTMISRRASG
jgi:hypothetical protein